MPERTYKLIELVGISEISTDEAIRNAMARASTVPQRPGLVRSHRGTGTRPRREGFSQFQVKLKVDFRIMSEDELRGA